LPGRGKAGACLERHNEGQQELRKVDALYVPIVFAGGSLTARRIYREIQTVDVAPTLAAIVGVKPPSGARGVPLVEVLQSQTGSTTVNP
jgi:arylsulfatase A-like enzyme